MSCTTCNTPRTGATYNNHKLSTSQYSGGGMNLGCYEPKESRPKCNFHRREYLPLIFPNSCPPDPCNTNSCPPVKTTKTLSKKREWIDDYLLNNFLFGERMVDSNLGIHTFSAIPQYLINSCPEQTPPNSNGRKVGPQFCNEEGTWQAYIRVHEQKAYLYIKNCETNQVIDIADWEWGIADCAIKNVSADKILDWCSLFAKATIPIEQFKEANGCFNDEAFITSPVTLTEDCQLKVVIPKSDIRKAVIPYLDNCKGQPLYEYNPITDERPKFIAGSLNGCVGVRVDKVTVVGQTDPEADYAGTDNNPLKSITIVKGHDDPEEEEGYLTGDGTLEKPLDIKENSLDDSRVAICKGGLTSRAVNYDNKFYSVLAEKVNPSARIKNFSFKSSRLVYEDNQVGLNKKAIWELEYEAEIPDTGCDDKIWIGQLSAWSRHPISTIRDSANRDVAIEYTLGILSNKGVYLNNTNDLGLKILARQGSHKSSNDQARNYASSTGYHLSCSNSIGIHGGKALFKIFTTAVFPNQYTNPAAELFDPVFGVMSTPDRWFTDCNMSIKLDGLITK